MTVEEIQYENNRRLDILYRTKNDWLMSAAYNITKNREMAKELVAELYSYVAERGNPNIWYGTDEMNMMYLHAFLRTRHINMVKGNSKLQSLPDYYDEIDEGYDEDNDRKIQQCYDDIVDEIQQLQKTRMWSSARLAELYFFGDEKMTLDKLSKDIGISKSTSFLNVKKIKQHIRLTKVNPFKPS